MATVYELLAVELGALVIKLATAQARIDELLAQIEAAKAAKAGPSTPPKDFP